MLARIQRLGGFLSSMVIPNIGAFIAWGLITALFIPTGWFRELGVGSKDADGAWISDWVSDFSSLVGPMIVYLLPALVAYTGGKLVHGHRGGVTAAIAVFGVILSQGELTADDGTVLNIQPPQFMGAMVIGPLAGWLMKKIDEALEDRTPAGFEMLVNNFSQGIGGMFMALIGFEIVGPIFARVADAFGSMVEGIDDAGLLPLADLPIEVAKVLFLNNAINRNLTQIHLGFFSLAQKRIGSLTVCQDLLRSQFHFMSRSSSSASGASPYIEQHGQKRGNAKEERGRNDKGDHQRS